MGCLQDGHYPITLSAPATTTAGKVRPELARSEEGWLAAVTGTKERPLFRVGQLAGRQSRPFEKRL